MVVIPKCCGYHFRGWCVNNFVTLKQHITKSDSQEARDLTKDCQALLPRTGHKVITKGVKEFVNQCFEQDKTAPNKHHHTFKRIYDRLVAEKDFQGAESTVRRMVSQLRPRDPERCTSPLAFSPGETAQVDWGTATVYIAGEKTIAHLFCVRLCHSCAPFAMAFPAYAVPSHAQTVVTDGASWNELIMRSPL